MKTTFLPLCLLAFLAGCKSPDLAKVTVEAPKVEELKIGPNEVLKKIEACDQRDDEGGFINGNVELVKQTQRVQRLDCEGHVLADSIEIVRKARTVLELEKRSGLTADVASARIENRRTCQGQTEAADLEGRSSLSKEMILFTGTDVVELPAPNAIVGKRGELQVALEDVSSWIFVNESVPVRDGLNTFDIVYFGKDNAEIARSTLRLTFQIREERLNGIKTIDTCTGDRK